MKYTSSEIKVKRSMAFKNSFNGMYCEKNAVKDILNLKCRPDGSLFVRPSRGYIRDFTDVNGIFADETLAYVDGQRLYYGGNVVDGIVLTPGEKQLLKIGSYLMVFPDGVYVNVDNPTKCGEMSLKIKMANVSAGLVDKDMKEIKCTVVDEYPEDAVNGCYYAVIGSDGTVTIKRYLNQVWEIAPTLVRINGTGLGDYFNVGDRITVERLENYIGSSAKVLWQNGNSLVVEGFIAVRRMFYNLYVKRSVPLFDYATVSGNRLYGVRRGRDASGDYVCRMYASAVGEPFNFYTDKGAMQADIEISGAFTGICDYLGSPVVFGENEIIETRVKNNSLVFTNVKGRGAERGASGSIAGANGVVYYKSRDGVCRYDGSFPERLLPLDECVWNDEIKTVGIYANGKYYIKITDNELKTAIYIYDEELKAWSRENDIGIKGFACRGRSIYATYENSGKQGLVLLNYGTSDENERQYCSSEGYPVSENEVSWSFEGAEIKADGFEGLLPVRAILRIKKEAGSHVAVGVIYDGMKNANEIVIDRELCGAVAIPIPLARCDTFRLTVRGSGECELFGYAVEMRKGGAAGIWK